MTARGGKAIQITREEALQMQWSMIGRWKPRSDVWPFTFGNGILAAASAMTGIYFIQVSRKALRVGQHGLRTSLAPLAILPPLFSALTHFTMVSSDILLKETRCPSCLETRAAISQLAVGLLYPIVFAPITAMYFAKSYYTFAVPDAYKVKELGKLWWFIVKPKLGRVQAMAICHLLLASAVTYMEMAALEKIEKKMDQGIIEL